MTRRWTILLASVMSVGLLLLGLPGTAMAAPAEPAAAVTCAAAWNSSTAYTGGATVSYNGHNWTAKWWTQGDTPDSSNVWTDQGACSGGGTPPNVGECAPEWDASTVYTGGDQVSYNGHNWTAKWWTKGQAPGSAGVWGDDGTCGATQAPAAPTELTVTATSETTVTLEWAASDGATSYNVYQGDTEVKHGVTGTSYTVAGLDAGTDYTFTVTAVNTAGESAHSDAAQATTDSPPTSPPAAPTGLNVTGTTSDAVALSWTASDGATSYTVYQGDTEVNSGVTGTSYTVTGLSADTDYTFTVTAVNSVGESGHSTAVTAHTAKTGSAPPLHGNGDGSLKIAYFDQWSIYLNHYYLKTISDTGIAGQLDYLLYDFENIHPTKLTCFEATKAAKQDESDPNAGDGAGDEWADIQKSFPANLSVDGTADTYDQKLAGNFNQLKELKAKYPDLKILLSIGGWTYSKYFSDAAATDASRKKLVSSCMDMFIKGNMPVHDGVHGGDGVAAGIFDGFDIDWEYPASDGGHVGNHHIPADKANFTKLLKEFRTQLDDFGAAHNRTMHLSAALSAGQDKIRKMETSKIGQYLDFADIMTYDMHGAWDKTGPTNFQDPIFPSPDDPSPVIKPGDQQYDIDTALKSYVDGNPQYGIPGGFPAGKLTMGIPFYYRTWTGVEPGDNYGLYQAATGPGRGQPNSGNVPGTAMYKELGKLISNPSAHVHYDPQRMAGWYYDPNSKNFVTGPTPKSIKAHVAYEQCAGMAGVMMFSLYDMTATDTTPFDNVVKQINAGKPADCSPYLKDGWGNHGPPTG